MTSSNVAMNVAKNHGGSNPPTTRRRATYAEQIAVRVPSGAVAALDRAAMIKRCSMPEYVRRLVLEGLERDGINLPPVEVNP